MTDQRCQQLPNDRSCLLLHAGGPKTGTDSIQRFFGYHAANHFKWIANHFELVKRTDYPTANLSSFTDRIENHYNQATQTAIETFISKQDIRSQLSAFKDKPLVFSSEQAGRPSLTPMLGKKQYQYLLQYSNNPYVLYYIRNPLSQCLALLTQSIKAGGGTNNVLPQFLKCQPNMKNILIFDALYGKANVICAPFDPINFHKQNILFDFCERIGKVDRITNIDILIQGFKNTNNGLPLVMLRLIQDAYQRVSIPHHSRMTLLNSFSTIRFAGRKPLHSDFMSVDQIACLSESATNEYEELASYLGTEPYPLMPPRTQDDEDVACEQDDADMVYNSNEMFNAGDEILTRLERLNALTDSLLQRPPLSNMGPVGGHASLKDYIKSLTQTRSKNLVSPETSARISLDYLINTSHALSEFTKIT